MAEINKNDIFAPDLNEPLKELQGTLEDVLGTLGHLRQSGKGMESTFKETAEVTKKTNAETEKLTSSLKDLENAEKKLGESKKQNAKVQEKELNALQLLKKELKEAQSAMLKAGDAGGTMSKDYQNAAKKAGELADKIGDAKDEAKVFANDTAFGALGTRIGLLKDKVLSLDFKGVGEQLKGIGQIIMANPLLLLAGVVTGIVIALVKFKDNIPLVGAAFDKIGGGIDYVVEKLKQFTDWLGISTFAQDELNKKIVEGAKEAMKDTEAKYNQEIKLAKIAGKETIDMEIAKQEALIESGMVGIAQLLKKKELGKEEKQLLKDLSDATSTAVLELDALRAQKFEENNKRRRKEVMDMEMVRIAIEMETAALEAKSQKELEILAAKVAAEETIGEWALEQANNLEKEKTDTYISLSEQRQAQAMKEFQVQTAFINDLSAFIVGAATENNLSLRSLAKNFTIFVLNQIERQMLAQQAATIAQATASIAAQAAASSLFDPTALVRAIGRASIITGIIKAAFGVARSAIGKFATGTSYSPEGLAYVGERGAELMNIPGQGLVLSPNKATLSYLKKGTEVIPHERSMSMLANAGLDIGGGKDFTMLTHLQLVNNSVKQIGGAIVNAVQESTGRMYEQGSQVFAVQKRLDGSRKLIRLKSLSA